jgi:bile acid:Na+ symporter, BASS family
LPGQGRSRSPGRRPRDSPALRQVGYFFRVGKRKCHANLEGYDEFETRNRPEVWNPSIKSTSCSAPCDGRGTRRCRRGEEGRAVTPAEMVALAVQASMALLIFCVGLRARFDDLIDLLQQPGLLVRSLLAMNVVMPAFAVAVALLFELNVVVEAALIAMALSPIPPILPGKELKAGGERSYIIGVLVVAGLLSIVFVPLAARLVAEVFGRPINVSSATIAQIVTTSILLPVVAGICLGRVAPALAAHIARPLSLFGTGLLVVAFVPVLIAERKALLGLVGNFSLVAIIFFVLVGLAVGHLLGGPDPDDRTVLALSTATRHPAVAMAVVHDAQDKASLLAAVLLVLLVGAVASGPYVKWRRRSHDASSARSPAAS